MYVYIYKFMYKLYLFKSAQCSMGRAIMHTYGNEINLVYDSEFDASSQPSGIQYYFYLPKNEQTKTVIYITFTISKSKI